MPRFTLHNVLAFGLALIFLSKMVIGKMIAITTLGQVVTILIAAGAGYALGWFLSPNAAAFRAAIKVGMTLLLALLLLGNNSMFGWSATYLAAMIAFFVALGIWVGAAVRALATRPTTFGSAEWATLPYLRAHNLVGTTGIRLGRFSTADETEALHYDSDRHLLTIAPTRSGKGTTAIVPNLLSYRGSVMVIDPKGENALITASQRRAMGQDVYIVDPWNIASGGEGAKFNPLDWLVAGNIDITENAMLLADALIVPEGDGDKFWIEEAKALLQGFILYVATSPYEEGQRTLPRMRDLLLLDGDDMKLLFQRMLDSEHHIVMSTGARCAQKEEKLLANVIASAQAQTHFLDSARLRESLSASDFKFEDLKTKPMSIYLVLPADRLNALIAGCGCSSSRRSRSMRATLP